MKKIKLSILICTIGQRADRFKHLISILEPQIKDKPVEVIAYWNNGEAPVGYVRQALVDEAQGEYVCFIDDDDEVPAYYVNEILPLLDGVDYIGWRMQLYHNGEKMKPTFHSLKYINWSEDANGYYRNVSHLNPIKKSLATLEPFVSEEGIPEDADWAERMAPMVKSEHYIERVMYFYRHSSDDSVWRGNVDKTDYFRPIIKCEGFKWHPACKEEYHGDTIT